MDKPFILVTSLVFAGIEIMRFATYKELEDRIKFHHEKNNKLYTILFAGEVKEEYRVDVKSAVSVQSYKVTVENGIVAEQKVENK